MKPPVTSASARFRSAPRLLAFFLLLAGLGFSRQASAASGFFNDYIVVTGSGTSNGGTYFYRANAGFNDPFQGANLGSYDRATGNLRLNGAQAHTSENGGDVIYSDSTFLYFRVYRQTAANGDAGQGFTFQRIRLPQTGVAGNGDRTFEQTNGTITLPNSTATTVNLVSLTSGPGTYVVEAYIQASGINNGTTKFRIFDSNSSANYKATFTINGTSNGQPVVGQAATTWLGGRNPGCDMGNGSPSQDTNLLLIPSNWFDPFNWSNGVPTAVTDVEVPNYNTNQCVVYPNINGTPQTGPAYARNLALRGNNAGDRSILRLVRAGGSLLVYGNLVNPADSYIQRASTTFALACACDQTFDGAQFFNLTIDGGGRKTLTNSLRVQGTLNMVNGVLVTGTVNPVNTNVTLVTGARITGEKETSYVEGVVIANEVAQPGVNQAFGNIGLDLTITGGDPGLTEVTRTTSLSAADLLAGKPSIKRYYGIRPTNANGPTNRLVARFGVRYLDLETRGVRNAQSPVPQDLTENDLTIWYSTSGGAGFFNAGRDRIDPTNNRVTQNGINTFATTTLGQNAAPLPVNFLYFTAGRDRTGAVLNWGTAQEKDNAGFEVQVSLDGREFRTLTTVAPVSANSSAPRHYTYTDATARTGTRYYRLRQVDTNGAFAYTPVRTVSFGGFSEESAGTSSVFPNPFRDGEQLMMNIKAATEGTAMVRVTDAMGREVTRQTAQVPAGASTLAVPSLDGKPVGVYLVRLVLPDGAAQTIKVQKQ